MRIKRADTRAAVGSLERSVMFVIISSLHSPLPKPGHRGFGSGREGTYPWKAILLLCVRASSGEKDRYLNLVV